MKDDGRGGEGKGTRANEENKKVDYVLRENKMHEGENKM